MRGLKGRSSRDHRRRGGIGRALVRRFCEEGATVEGLDLNAAGLEELGGQLKEFADQLTLRPLDITDHAAVAVTIRQVHAERGRIDILVNNAGWDVAMQFVETTPEFWDKVIAINLRGPLNLHHAVVPLMIDAERGEDHQHRVRRGPRRFVGRIGVLGVQGRHHRLQQDAGRETARKDVRVNVRCPGPTDTALLRSFMGEGEYGQKIYEGLKRAIPLKRLGQPEDIPGIVAFLASDDANFITGQVISVSGGLTMHG